MRAAAYELRMVQDEMQITKEELKTAGGSCGLSRLDNRRTRKNFGGYGRVASQDHDLESGLPRGP